MPYCNHMNHLNIEKAHWVLLDGGMQHKPAHIKHWTLCPYIIQTTMPGHRRRPWGDPDGLTSDHSGYGLSLWEMTLPCNVISHCLSPYKEWSLLTMMTSSNGNIFPLLSLYGLIHWSQVNSPHKGQWHSALMFSLICAWTNNCVNNHEAGDLRCHRTHDDATVNAPTPTIVSRHLGTALG